MTKRFLILVLVSLGLLVFCFVLAKHFKDQEIQHSLQSQESLLQHLTEEMRKQHEVEGEVDSNETGNTFE